MLIWRAHDFDAHLFCMSPDRRVMRVARKVVLDGRGVTRGKRRRLSSAVPPKAAEVRFEEGSSTRMSLLSWKPEARRLGTGAVALAMALIAPDAQAQASGAFSGLEGAWSGTGTITLSSGASERIRCRAAYRV